MSAAVEYRSNKASDAEIAEHLTCCDASFVPPLSTQVEIDAYAKKITDKAMRFEAWADGKLVGLVAVYCNDHEGCSAFITSVSVLPAWLGNGIATRLLDQCIEHSQASGMRQINLEVASGNNPAVKLYAKRGFVAGKSNAQFVCMRLNLESEE